MVFITEYRMTLEVSIWGLRSIWTCFGECELEDGGLSSSDSSTMGASGMAERLFPWYSRREWVLSMPISAFVLWLRSMDEFD